MNIETLKKLSADQLVELAGKTGVKFHPRKKLDTIKAEAAADPEAFAKLILEAVTVPQNANTNAEFDPANTRVNKIKAMAALDTLNTSESIEEAIAHVKKRVPEFTSTYNKEDNTWHFKCKGAEDSGNIAIPMRVIVQKADLISRGRIAPRSLNKEFGDIATPGNSVYTNTVLV